MGRDPLTMGYFDNLDNATLNKLKRILKIGKQNFIDIMFNL
jgi:hypothetical protein